MFRFILAVAMIFGMVAALLFSLVLSVLPSTSSSFTGRLVFSASGWDSGDLGTPERIIGLTHRLLAERFGNAVNNFERVAELPDDARFRRLSQGVGRIEVKVGDEVVPCTGALVSGTHVLTAGHCFFGEDGAPFVGAQAQLRLNLLGPRLIGGADGSWSGVILEAAPSPMKSVIEYAAFSPNGDRIVTPLDDGTVGVGQKEANEPWSHVLFDRHSSWVTNETFSPTGDRTLSGSRDASAQIWRAAPDGSWNGVALEGHSAEVDFAAFSKLGERILTASRDGTTRIWREAADGRWYDEVLKGRSDKLSAAAFLSRGNRLLTLTYGGDAPVWHIAFGRELLAEVRLRARGLGLKSQECARLQLVSLGCSC